jgi:hypothetical protein
VVGTEQGLGWHHQQDKARLLRELVDGTPCPLVEWCGGAPMIHPSRCEFGPCFWCTLERDHSVARVLGGHDSPGRLSHARCNHRAGAALGNKLRGARSVLVRQPW